MDIDGSKTIRKTKLCVLNKIDIQKKKKRHNKKKKKRAEYFSQMWKVILVVSHIIQKSLVKAFLWTFPELDLVFEVNR